MEQQLQSETKLRLVNGGQANYSSNSGYDHLVDEADNLTAKLPSILQTTLDLHELVLLFQKQIQSSLNFDSYHFQNIALNCDINSAPARHHSCHYTLEMNSVYLGDITITRRKAFKDDELKLFEELLCTLVYPLRNCIMYKQAINASLLDNLTGLNNRAAFDTSLHREIDLAVRQHSPLSIVVLDIDHFKIINDTYGHSSGDSALKKLAHTISSTLRSCDIAFRYGGEEFTLILSNTDLAAAKKVANRLRIAVSQLCCEDEKHTFGFTISLGLAQMHGGEDSHTLFNRADKALYEAKKAGRNAVVCA